MSCTAARQKEAMINTNEKPPRPGVVSSVPDVLRTEVAVIGSGPGGAITAALFAEAGRDVLLLEEGPYLDLDSCQPFSREEMVQKYRNGGITVAIGKPKIAYVEGCCVGGGSEINSGLYHRTPSAILEEWRRSFQVEAMTEEDLRPMFEASERDVSVSPLPGPAPAASLMLHRGAVAMGWRSVEALRWYKYESQAKGSSACQGIRQSMTRTFIPRALTAGARLLPVTRVLRLRKLDNRWHLTAVHNAPRRGLQRLCIEASSVFVACGAIQTPTLLRRSGICQFVGDSLGFHPTVKVIARFPHEVNTPNMGVPVHQTHEFEPRFTFGCSISSAPFLALAMADHPLHLTDVQRDWRRMAIYYAAIRGGSGTVRPVPFSRDPLVRYQLRTEDMRELAEALAKLSESLLAAGAEVLYPTIAGVLPLTQLADIDRLPRVLPVDRANLMTVHLFGSCPMGENRKRCPVDSFGKVRSLDGLYVADGSLLCGPPGVNPQGSIMAIARRNALKFLGKL